MHPATTDGVAGLHAAIDAARLAVGADAIPGGNAGAIDAALLALLFEYPAAATGDAALLIALKAARGKARADGLTAAVVVGIAAGTAGAVKGKALAVSAAGFQIGFVAAQLAGFA